MPDSLRVAVSGDPIQDLLVFLRNIRKTTVSRRDEFRNSPRLVTSLLESTVTALKSVEEQAAKESAGARGFAQVGDRIESLKGPLLSRFPELITEIDGFAAAVRSCDKIADEWDGVIKKSADLREQFEASLKADVQQSYDMWDQLVEFLDRIISVLEK